MVSHQTIRPFDLTNDRPLSYHEAQQLANWWNQQPNISVNITRAHSTETHKRYHVAGAITKCSS